MFPATIDLKSTVVDPNGNTIVDFTPSIFKKTASAFDAYNTVKMSEHYQMRPDRVSFLLYGSDARAEMVLKYSGISNPFSLDKDDVLLIPEEEVINNLVGSDIEEDSDNANNIRSYFKYKSTYQKDTTSYDNMENMTIASGAVDTNEPTSYSVPYISEDGKTAITIRNGRMYFGEDAGPTAATNLDEKIQNLINSTATAIADQCAMNGLSLSDFVRASTKNNS